MLYFKAKRTFEYIIQVMGLKIAYHTLDYLGRANLITGVLKIRELPLLKSGRWQKGRSEIQTVRRTWLDVTGLEMEGARASVLQLCWGEIIRYHRVPLAVLIMKLT